MRKTKEPSSWISSSFEDFPKPETTGTTSHRTVHKRKTSKQIKVPEPDDQVAWVHRYVPTSKDDLAVHKRKVEQVEEWIQTAQSSIRKKNNIRCPILLLTGPSGAGKTATITTLALQFNLALQEWKNANNYVFYSSHQSDQDVMFEERQISTFNSFLLRASRYSELFNEQQEGQIVLVEEMPNACLREPESFHSLLRKYVELGHSPTVFILSESSRGEMCSQKLFPKGLVQELAITEINFNPITSLSVCKVFTKILAAEKVSSKSPIRSLSKPELDALAESSGGDIRSAINALQFAASPSAPVKKKVVAVKKGKASPEFKVPPSKGKGVSNSFGGKDTALILFHALGKILYCKRDANKSEPLLPSHLSKHQRQPLIENPEDVVERTVMSSGGFNLFLHQNYLEFFSDSEYLVEASNYLSVADCLLPKFEEQGPMTQCASSVGVRGLMFHLGLGNGQHSSHKNRWLPLRKPAWYDTNRIRQKNLLSIQYEFQDSRLRLGEELYLSMIPYTKLISLSSQTAGQRHLIQNLTKFSRSGDLRPRGSEVLEEEDDDFINMLELNAAVSMNSDNALDLNSHNEDNVQIEEFSD